MLLGAAFGAATSWLLDGIFRDDALATVVTLLSAYASYYTADSLVGASGLLAVVCNGFAMSLMGARAAVRRLCGSAVVAECCGGRALCAAATHS